MVVDIVCLCCVSLVFILFLFVGERLECIGRVIERDVVFKVVVRLVRVMV